MTVPVFQPASLSDLLLKAFPLGHISASAAKQFQRCPEQFRRVRLLGEKAAPGAALIQGSSDHAAVAFNYEQKIESGEDLPVPEVQEFFAAELDRRVEAEDVDWSGFDGKTTSQAHALVKDQGTALVGLYQRQVAPEIQPLTIEEGFDLPLDGLPLTVKGYVDLTATRRDQITGDHSKPMIVERKTRGSNRPPKPEDHFQARVYQLFKPLPAEIQISVRSKVPQVKVHELVQPAPAEITLRSLRAIVLEIGQCHMLYGLEQPWPDRGRVHDWACSYCSVRPTCAWWHEEHWPK